MLAAIAIAAAVAFVLVRVVGDWYLEAVGSLDYATLSVVVLCLLCLLAWLFAGGVGVVVLCVATLVGLVPVCLGTRRVHLMGVLLGPIILGDVCAKFLLFCQL
ncbi:hypothetical protein ACFQH3_08815 [Haladaptatus sp. GCM10025707]